MESIVVSGQAMSIQISSCFPMATKLHKGKISNGETGSLLDFKHH
jgi:hypothetical protein